VDIPFFGHLLMVYQLKLMKTRKNPQTEQAVSELRLEHRTRKER